MPKRPVPLVHPSTTTSPSSASKNASSSKSWIGDKVDLNAHFGSKKQKVPAADSASPSHSSSSPASTSDARAALFNRHSERALANQVERAINLKCLYRK